ncbi:MAG: hypothetical protein ICV66_14020 [Chitinophagaceae bacterium]|nr:hypothetical protein [Chitinophagaceae bacterium]
MRHLPTFRLLLCLFIIAQSCKKNGDDGGGGGPQQPAKITITGIKADLPNENRRNCVIQNAPANGDKHRLFISYTSNKDIKQYNTKLRMIITSNVTGIKPDTLRAQVDSVNAQTVFHNLCLYMNYGISYVIVECRLTLNDKTNDTIVATSNSDTVRINNPRVFPTKKDFELVGANVNLFKLNSCTTGAGTGSDFHSVLKYENHIPLFIDEYYIEAKVDYAFNNGGTSGSFIATPIAVDGVLRTITLSTCATYGNISTSFNYWYTVKLYEKDQNGKPIGNGFLITNTIGPIAVPKPAGASRTSGSSSLTPLH